jgi:hypothetical protein
MKVLAEFSADVESGFYGKSSNVKETWDAMSKLDKDEYSMRLGAEQVLIENLKS